MSMVCLTGGIIPLHLAPLHPCPFPCGQPFKGLGWPGAQQRTGLTTAQAAGPSAATRTPIANTTWWHPCALWGGSVRSALQQSPVMIWRLKAWLYHHTAMSCVLMTLSINYTSFCPGLIVTNSFGWYKLSCFQGSLTGAIAALKNLIKKFKMWKPIAAAEKIICRKTENTSNKGRQGGGMLLSKAPPGHSKLKSKAKTACKTKSCQWRVQQTAGAKGSSWKQSCCLPSPLL